MNSDTFFTALEQTFAINELSLRLRENQKEQLFNATNIILEKNKVMNLTAICSENEFVSRHWADALTAAEFIPGNASLLDVGTGGGILALAYRIYPCLPWIRPQRKPISWQNVRLPSDLEI